ncbi:dehydrogenase/reductase SDR family member 8 precursor [Lentithecium fluviatile CBS 122367]|uniref:Short-chain dehydrogenase/reductase 3 n=1 Tax=Lentithecium fluviatile CBS 122367 TaxID=1168545 RepID=A0A6G1JBQ6_9PLEO|nr:dehydrogenase/reductase SDR family member 8 precursor [Lentithecium fluviatile CBS 122367]
MPIRSEWKLARVSFTNDTLVRALKLTAFNPALTLPLILLARYTAQGGVLASEHATAFKHLKTLATLGVLNAASSFLSDRVVNNWKSDEWDWSKEGKEVVVVTGGSDGIGKKIVGLFAESGVKVAVLDVQGLTYEAPPTVHYFHCDLASPASIAHAATQIRSTLGAPTVLINNAGCARGKSILNLTESDIRLTFNVNTLSHYFLTQQFLPSMIEHNHGMVVTVASLAGYLTAPSMVDYAASKSAAVSFHEGLAAELTTLYHAPKVRTVLMCQGYTRTALFEGFAGKALYPETVAEEIVKAVFAGKSASLTLPETAWGIAPKVRGWPLWMQYAFRGALKHLMSGWKGRQVMQPSEVGEKEGEKGVGESTVLVGKE